MSPVLPRIDFLLRTNLKRKYRRFLAICMLFCFIPLPISRTIALYELRVINRAISIVKRPFPCRKIAVAQKGVAC